MTRWRAALRSGVVLCVVALAVLLPLSPASAHATLLGSDPKDGSVLKASPDVVTLRFDEPVRSTARSIRVFDARGAVVPTDVSSRGSVVSASLPAAMATGSYVVAWRVVSDDSHPVSGSITFSVGKPSPTVVEPKGEHKGQAGDESSLTRPLSITAGLSYLSLFTAGGLILFVLWPLGGVRLRPEVADRLVVGRWAGACLAVLTAVNALPLQGADEQGLGVHGAGDSSALDLSLLRGEVVVLVLQVVGLAVGLLLLRRHRWLSTAGAVLAVTSPAWVGHSRSAGPSVLVVPADVLHLLAGAVWFGGLLGLGLTLGTLRERPPEAAAVLSRFSAIAASVLVVLTATGAIAAWRIVGSWSALVHTGYGRLLLVKLAVAAVAVAIAGFNRWRLLRAVGHGGRHGVGHGVGDGVGPGGEPGERGSTVLRVRTAVWSEAALLVVVLAVTGFLVNLSPNS